MAIDPVPRPGRPMPTAAVVGVIGGMGPLATADFFRKVLACTPADDDAGHVPLVIASDPRIPARPAALLAEGPSPLPALRSLRDRLVAFGARMLVMPCNTAHHWHAELTRDCGLPFPSIVEVSCEEAAQGLAPGARVGLIATRATLAARLFEPALQRHGLHPLLPDEALLRHCILPAIADVKAGRLDRARAPMHRAVQALLEQGAQRVLLACTEAPLALDAASPEAERSVDTTAALARATVRGWASLQDAAGG
jgi:aspartate racemase